MFYKMQANSVYQCLPETLTKCNCQITHLRIADLCVTLPALHTQVGEELLSENKVRLPRPRR